MSISPICSADIITQGYGCTDYVGEWVDLSCAGGHRHTGIDLGYSDGGNNHLGDPIHAARAGTVVVIGPRYPGNGAQYLGPYAPCILGDEGVILEYGHVQAVHVNIGQRVKAHDWIADLGTLGASSGGHLHLEARWDAAIQGPPFSAIVDPSPYLVVPQEDDMTPEEHTMLADLHQTLIEAKHFLQLVYRVQASFADLDATVPDAPIPNEPNKAKANRSALSGTITGTFHS